MSERIEKICWLEPGWPAPPRVHAISLLRGGGVSNPPFDSLNPALHVGDDKQAVVENRRRIRVLFSLPSEPLWLNQVHGTTVSDCTHNNPDPQADGSYARGVDRVLAILTADCLPILVCDRKGEEVAALHAGWRGLAAGVIESGLSRFRSPPEGLIASIGPGIGAGLFEVGEEVRVALCRHRDDYSRFTPSHRKGRWLADLKGLARSRLERLGVSACFSMGGCTAEQGGDYFSYRRDHPCGRMATLLWLGDHPRVEGARRWTNQSGGGFYRCQPK